LALWDGVYEAKAGIWLRWRDANGVLLPTGAEAAETAQEQAAQAQEQAEQERERAERAEQLAAEAQLRAERLAAQLRALGVEPED
jgi:hypothetical protein